MHSMPCQSDCPAKGNFQSALPQPIYSWRSGRSCCLEKQSEATRLPFPADRKASSTGKSTSCYFLVSFNGALQSGSFHEISNNVLPRATQKMFAMRICNPTATFGANVIVNTFSSLLVFYSGPRHFGLTLSLQEVSPGGSGTVSGPAAAAISMFYSTGFPFLNFSRHSVRKRQGQSKQR